MSRAIDIGGLRVSEGGTSLALRFDTPVPDDCMVVSAHGDPVFPFPPDSLDTPTSRVLDRRQVEQLVEVCKDFLAGRRL